jgi:small subunit ribosomal protein S6
MRSYETTILVRLSAIRADKEGTLAAVRGLYEIEGAKFIDFKEWEERRLAYPIAGETNALYIIAYFEADPLAIEKIERRVQLNEIVLRQLIVSREGKALAKIQAQRIKAAEQAAAAAAAAAIAAAAGIPEGY